MCLGATHFEEKSLPFWINASLQTTLALTPYALHFAYVPTLSFLSTFFLILTEIN